MVLPITFCSRLTWSVQPSAAPRYLGRDRSVTNDRGPLRSDGGFASSSRPSSMPVFSNGPGHSDDAAK